MAANARGIVHRYKYGEAEVVGFDSPWRREIYRPFSVSEREPWNREIPERCMAAGPTDDTPRQSTIPGDGYNTVCSCCYLGITHTEAVHRRSVR